MQRKMTTIWPRSRWKGIFEDYVLLFGCLETLAHILPVDDIPDSLNIVRPHIFVLKVVGMLPYIDTEEGDETLGSETGNDYSDGSVSYPSYI